MGFCCIVAVYKIFAWVWYLTWSKIQKIITVHLRGHNVRGKVLIEYNSLNRITLPISTQCPFRSRSLSCWRSTATRASTEDSTAKGPKALTTQHNQGLPLAGRGPAGATQRAAWALDTSLSLPGNTLPWEHRPGCNCQSHLCWGSANQNPIAKGPGWESSEVVP